MAAHRWGRGRAKSRQSEGGQGQPCCKPRRHKGNNEERSSGAAVSRALPGNEELRSWPARGGGFAGWKRVGGLKSTSSCRCVLVVTERLRPRGNGPGGEGALPPITYHLSRVRRRAAEREPDEVCSTRCSSGNRIRRSSEASPNDFRPSQTQIGCHRWPKGGGASARGGGARVEGIEDISDRDGHRRRR